MCRIKVCDEWYDEQDDSYRRDDLFDTLHRKTSKMTLALAFIGKDGIVMATDSARAYFDDSGSHMRTETTQKLYKLGNYTGLALVSQQAGVSDWMVHRFNTTVLERNQGLVYDDAVNVFTQYTREFWDIYTKNMPASLIRDKTSQVSFILCGYTAKCEPSIVQSVSVSTPDVFAPSTFNKYCALGCYDEAEYWIGKIKSRIDMDKIGISTLKRLCLFLIRETVERYPKLVQEPVQMLTITDRNGVTLVADGELVTLGKSVRTFSNQDRVLKMLLGTGD